MYPVNEANRSIQGGESSVGDLIMQVQQATDDFLEELKDLSSRAGTDPQRVAAFNAVLQRHIDLLTAFNFGKKKSSNL